MTLAPGSRVGSYEVIGSLGAGGMGEVYRARDTKLKREVALKVLPESLAADPDRLARFAREAELLAALNHPHIAHIYGVEDADPTYRALAMELVDGPTLADRLAGGAVPFEELRPLAIQIADALAYAHEHGIIHRDLKPANIKLTVDGAVKVLDFGLAKAVSGGPGASTADDAEASALLTFTSPAVTRVGLILGTAAYMAPEQARGVAVDKRADIWAFGVILFELLSGQHLFAGDNVSDTLAAVLKTDPDFAQLPASTPLTVRRLLQRCLQKDRRRRLQDIGDARIELEEFDPHEYATPAASPASGGWFGRLRTAVLLTAGVGVGAIATTFWPGEAGENAAGLAKPYQFLVTSADGVALDDPPNFAVSPDGQFIALRGLDAGVPYVYLRSLVDGAVRRLVNTRGATPGMFWAPDSRSLGFRRERQLYRVQLTDGRAMPAAESDVLLDRLFTQAGASWSDRGDIVVSAESRLVLLPSDGGATRRFVEPPSQTTALTYPWWLPNGQLLVQATGTVAGEILVVSTDSSIQPRRIETGAQPAFVQPGWLLAMRAGQLLAWRFDPLRAEITSDAVVVRENVSARGGIGGRGFSVSNTGVLAIRNDVQPGATRLSWFDRSGREVGGLKLDRHCRNPELAPDGVRLAMECYDLATTNRDVWLYDLLRDTATRLTLDQADDADPLWSPDGRTILFASNRKGPPDLYRKSAGGVTPEELVLETPGATPTSAWSPDGLHVALNTGGMFHLLELGKSELVPFTPGPYTSIEAQFSPDGRFISYSSDESGRFEIYVQPWPATGDKWQISTDGATDARWRRDGKEIFYLSPTRELMAAAIDTTSGFKVGTASRLFQTSIVGPLGTGHRFPYAVAPDGKRFLMYVSDVKAPPPSITVIVNWTETVREQARPLR